VTSGVGSIGQPLLQLQPRTGGSCNPSPHQLEWTATDLTEQQAHATAADLDVQYDAHGPRPARSVRRVDPYNRSSAPSGTTAGSSTSGSATTANGSAESATPTAGSPGVPGPDLRPTDQTP
jgi:hypothetical protein